MGEALAIRVLPRRCGECSTLWPCAPARPKLAGGCRGCKREYTRLSNASDYAKHGERRRTGSRLYYNDNKDKINERRLEDYLKKVGLTLEDYERVLNEQGGVCAICGGTETGRFNRLAVDHCHETGEFRGLLCSRCNKAIGLLRDNPEIVQGALDYLRAPKEVSE